MPDVIMDTQGLIGLKKFSANSVDPDEMNSGSTLLLNMLFCLNLN